MTVYTFAAPQTLARNSVTINAATMSEQTIAALLRGILEVEESDFEVSGILANIDALAEAISASDRAAMLTWAPTLDLTFTTGASGRDWSDTMKTLADIANEIVNSLNKDGSIKFAGLDRSPDQNELTRAIVRRAIETDRKQWADMAAFGRFVYDLMDGEEWSSDTLQAIGDYAAFTLKRPFSEPEA